MWELGDLCQAFAKKRLACRADGAGIGTKWQGCEVLHRMDQMNDENDKGRYWRKWDELT